MDSPADLARAIIHLWCDELTEEQHFKKDASVDRHIAERFGRIRDEVLASKAAGWRDDPETLAAAIILLEHLWAIPLRDAIRRAGGEQLDSIWITADELVRFGFAAALEEETPPS